MGVRVVHVMTHDSIGLGEDGPTHQPVEHLASLRAMPNLLVFRPADAVEAAECWQLALEAQFTRPSVMALSRQKVPQVGSPPAPRARRPRGLCELKPALGQGRGQPVRLGLGSVDGLWRPKGPPGGPQHPDPRDLHPLLGDLRPAGRRLSRSRPSARPRVRIAVEAGVRMGWETFIGEGGGFVGMSDFGASAPYERLYREFGITAEHVVAMARDKLGR